MCDESDGCRKSTEKDTEHPCAHRAEVYTRVPPGDPLPGCRTARVRRRRTVVLEAKTAKAPVPYNHRSDAHSCVSFARIAGRRCDSHSGFVNGIAGASRSV